MIGGSFCLSAAQSAFDNRLITSIAATAPEIDPATVLLTGATQIRDAFTPAQVPVVVAAYMAALKVVFAITSATFGFATVFAFCFAGFRRINAMDSR